jgi:hypothetical protein
MSEDGCGVPKYEIRVCVVFSVHSLNITAGMVPAYLPLSSPNVDKASLIE